MTDSLTAALRALPIRRARRVELVRAEKEFELLTWWNVVRRLELRGRITSLQKEIATADRKIGDDGVRKLAECFGEYIWTVAAEQIVPAKNPFGPAVRRRFDEILQLSLANRPDAALPVAPNIGLDYLPEIAALLTDSFIESNALRIMDERDRVAASTVYLTRETRTAEATTLVIQHLESGLRAEFTMDGSGFGEVLSRSGHIESLDPEKPGAADCKRYAGLGIGQGIYAEAQRRRPGVRWRRRHLSAYSEPLRSRLHVLHPYLWEGPCTWCEQVLPELDGKGWKDKDQSAFATHP